MRQGGECSLGRFHVGLARRLLQRIKASEVARQIGRFDRMKDLVRPAAAGLDAAGVSIEDFENWERRTTARHFFCHVEGRRQRHERMEADVIMSAKRSGVGQCSRRNERAQVGPILQLLDKNRHELVGRRFLHQHDQRLEPAELKHCRRLAAPNRRETQVVRQHGSDAGDQHPSTYVLQKRPTRLICHGHGFYLRGKMPNG